MKTVKVTLRSRVLKALLMQARRANLILRDPDGREFILAEINDFDREIELTRKNKELMKLLDERGKQTSRIPLDHVKAELGLD